VEILSVSESVSIEGPIDLENGRLILRIPLEAGGDKLAPFAKGIGEVEGDELVVEIKPWLAEMLNVGATSLVVVDNIEGKFRVTRSAANDA
jgi:hypothetical protein